MARFKRIALDMPWLSEKTGASLSLVCCTTENSRLLMLLLEMDVKHRSRSFFFFFLIPVSMHDSIARSSKSLKESEVGEQEKEILITISKKKNPDAKEGV
eukprot:TRINITY_DN10820_c0_g1_i1.p2 TRINITY_DN10820_c0_g1~~TRINITY_DN10820_c0_g1_i1.p2  ORF type:complete len:100 (-),score=5.27 TRINITY_DN10820_c0_g1_i1:27-326(-)